VISTTLSTPNGIRTRAAALKGRAGRTGVNAAELKVQVRRGDSSQMDTREWPRTPAAARCPRDGAHPAEGLWYDCTGPKGQLRSRTADFDGCGGDLVAATKVIFCSPLGVSS
jgi:hypothetical protein